MSTETVKKPRVFVTHETSLDFLDAERYGEIVFLTRDDLHNIKNSLHNESVLRFIREGLRDYDPEVDWVVIAGSPYVAAAVFLMLGHKKIQQVRVLRWSNRDRAYLPMYLDLRREVTQ